MKMWLLDTVVVSELRKAHRMDKNVMAWHCTVSPMDCWLSVITLAEIRIGILRVSKRDKPFALSLQEWYHKQLIENFHPRLLNVDTKVAELSAEMSVNFGLSPYDSLIAATTEAHGLTLVTRNTKDFQRTNIKWVNPWEN